MRIGHKLFLGFGLYVIIAVLGCLLAYKDLRAISTKLALVELADDTSNTILEVRRFEKNFLIYRDDYNLQELKKYLAALKKDTDHIAVEIRNQIGTEKFDVMKTSLGNYEGLIDRIATNLKSQEQLSETVRATGREIEKRLRGEDLRSFLIVRRHEKNLLIYKDRPTYETFRTVFAPLSARSETARYSLLVDRLYKLFLDEKDSVDKMRLEAREIQSFTEEISKRERENIGKLLMTSRNFLIVALLTILAVGIFINMKLAQNIAAPIRKLEKVTKKVALGDFSEVVEVSGRDEITSLEISFNQMEDRLRDTLSSLELSIQKLHEKQAQLVEAEKLASVGILAAGIAHEINNPLTSVLTFSNLMLEQMPEDDPRRERLKMMARETERARVIVRQLLSFAKETPLKLAKKNVNCPINEMVETLTAQGTFKDIEVTLGLAEDLPEISMDSVRIEQVILNMLMNAVHAITPPGKISISTKAGDDFIEISVSDTGCGIAEQNISKIFDPFYTTKDSTKGTGLGLAVSYGIIKKHGGDIEVRSKINEGSTFIVRLPIKRQ